jgi:hypothetical protein
MYHYGSMDRATPKQTNALSWLLLSVLIIVMTRSANGGAAFPAAFFTRHCRIAELT